MTFIFRNRTIFWDISKWNRGQKNGTKGVFNLVLAVVPLIRVLFFDPLSTNLLYCVYWTEVLYTLGLDTKIVSLQKHILIS